MSIFSKILNKFSTPDPESGSSYTADNEIVTSGTPRNEAPQVSLLDIDNPLEADPAQVKKIFNKVVEVFNSSLPSFFSASVDPERQKKYLYDALDASVKEYLIELENEAQERSQEQWQNERAEQKREMENLRKRTRDLEAKRAEINEQKLSADRQKRALTERVRDLEQKVLQLEAEKEQYDIENKSLINKAKVANVYENDLEEMRKELEALRSKGASAETVAELESLKAEVERLKEENSKLADGRQAALMKNEMDTAMQKDYQKQAAAANRSLKEAEQKIEELTEQINVKNAQLDDLKAEVAEKDARIAEDEATLTEIETIAEEMGKFESVKQQLEERIKKLRDELKEAEKQNGILRTTIQNNLYSQAYEKQELEQQINTLKAQKPAEESVAPQETTVAETKEVVNDDNEFDDIDDALFDSSSFQDKE